MRYQEIAEKHLRPVILSEESLYLENQANPEILLFALGSSG
jgi:hypothetical protein